MGNGQWATTRYHERAAVRAAAGADTFDYSKRAIETGRLVVHQTLSPQGMLLRESRDSAEHPASNAIVISLDVTGSMGRVVRGIHANLPQLHELLLGHKYVTDPQICFAAVGDATCDAVPLQVGQFESDNRMDENLENMILEGGGGGQNTESYELILYVAARHTAMDCWDKRQKKGYLFIIGDEMAYPMVSAQQVGKLIGPELPCDLQLADLVAEAEQRFHVYFIVPGGASHGHDPKIIGFWEKALGRDHVIILQDPGETSECIALTIGMNEGTIDLPAATQRMQQRGLMARTIQSLTSAFNSIFGTSKPDGSSPTDRRL